MMKKRTIILLIAIASLITATSTTVWYNLKANAVYYAKHIPHKEEENPELVFLIENLVFIGKPSNHELDISYDSLSHKIYPKKGYILERSYLNPDEYMLFMSEKGKYIWDSRGQFAYYTKYGEAEIKLTDNHYKEAAEKELSAIIDPIIRVQREPDLNLQWLFNWLHKDRFNQER